jgi:hypothetical protein
MPKENEDDLNEIPYPDEAFNTWGAASIGVDPLEASFQEKPYSPIRPHVPFYRFFSYPDVLELRDCGYEVERFVPLMDLLDDARYRQALQVSYLLHVKGASPSFNPRRARELDLEIRSLLHDLGKSEIPTLIRRLLGKAFPGDSMNHISVDLINVFYWAALAEVARDHAWRRADLAWKAEYLWQPMRMIFGAEGETHDAD